MIATADHLHHAMQTHARSGVWLELSCLVGMMVPLLLPTLRRVALASFWSRRHRAIGACLAGYLVIWTAVALLLAVLLEGSVVLVGPLPTLVIAATVAVRWHFTRARRVALRGCHLLLPLAPSGWRADADCLRLGAATGVHCVLTCWAMMTVVFATGHHVLVAGGVFAVLVVDRYGSHAPVDTVCAMARELTFGFAGSAPKRRPLSR